MMPSGSRFHTCFAEMPGKKAAGGQTSPIRENLR
jgi:hypothetical protein